MSNENEPAKLLLPYLQRADELQKHEPLVAYYCRLYAMERGLKIPQSGRTKTTNQILVSLMNQLEKDKKSLKLGPDNHLHLEGFALNVFAKADKQDRAGRADLNTAKTFYAASIFFEILDQFGELQPDVSELEQKQKYAAWKAADIRKALKEGRRPVPGPPGNDGSDNNLSLPSSTSAGEYDLETSSSDPDFRPGADPDLSPWPHDRINSYHPPTVPPAPSSESPQSPSSHKPPPTSYSSANYPSHDFHSSPSINRSESSTYSQPYHHQTYSQEPQEHFSQDCPSQEASSYLYPNFQSYPSFTDASLPTAPSHYHSYQQGSDSGYSSPPAPTATNYPSNAQYSSSSGKYDFSNAQYNSSSGNGTVLVAAPTPAQKYQYDSSYQPPAEKIAEAHKAARFAVGALAFDDVSVAVDHLKKSLELLTNPAANH